MSTKRVLTPALAEQFLPVVDHHMVAFCIVALAAAVLIMATGFALKLAGDVVVGLVRPRFSA